MVHKFARRIRAFLHLSLNKKHYFELVAAILTIPVLLTVLVTNIHNLSAEEKKEEDIQPKDTKIVISYAPQQEKIITETKTAATAKCKESIPPISIEHPDENETVTDNPLSFTITDPEEGYCAIVWSYRINDGKWSEFDDKSISIYDLPRGNARFELRVKSLISGEERLLKRTFTYEGTPADTSSLDEKTASSSAN